MHKKKEILKHSNEMTQMTTIMRTNREWKPVTPFITSVKQSKTIRV
jgi:hypothetical protein